MLLLSVVCLGGLPLAENSCHSHSFVAGGNVCYAVTEVCLPPPTRAIPITGIMRRKEVNIQYRIKRMYT